MSRKLVLLPVSAGMGLAVGLLLSRRSSTGGPAPAEAQPRPPEPGKERSRESLMQLNGSLVSGSCQVQMGSGPIGNLKIRVGPSPLLMLLTGAAIGIAVHHLLSHREDRARR